MDRDPGILICCYPRTQASGLKYPSSSRQGSRHLGPSLFPLLPLPYHLPWDPALSAPRTLLECQMLRLDFQQPRFHCQGPGPVPGSPAPAALVLA